jgi:thymidylate synthase (FAD)
MHSVKLIAITQPIEELGGTAENAIAYMARVSNPNNQNNNETSDKLIRYLIQNEHWSPFEMISIVMEIKTTRDISRQILRHRSFSFQEFSQRYAVVENFHTEREPRLQDLKNRQNSVDLDYSYEPHRELAFNWIMIQKATLEASRKAYEWAIENDIAKEQARALLPEGLTLSTLYMSGTLRSWIHYCQLRTENGTQKEHAAIAKDCWKIIGKNFPNVIKALQK